MTPAREAALRRPARRAAAAAATEAFARLLLDDLPREHGFEPLAVDGELPGDLAGTLFRNGPALFELFGRRYSHPFEGDGAVTAVRLEGGAARGAVTITRSEGLEEERAAGKMLYSFAAPRWRRLWNAHAARRQKNTANTNVISWRGRLLALMEAAPPTEIDPETLETLGETDLDGAVRGGFSAHPHRVAARRATYNFGVRYGRKNAIDLYELPDDAAARHLGSVPIGFSPMLHDFMATERHLVFFLSPVSLRLGRFMLQRGGFTELFGWDDGRATEVICVPIDEPERPIRFEVDPFYQWHFANGFERGGEIVIDLVRYPDFSSFAALGRPGEPVPPGTLHRARLDPAARRLAMDELDAAPVEFPRVHPRREGAAHGVTWMTSGTLDAVCAYDHRAERLERVELPAGQITSEVVFAPRPGASGERDGYLLGLVYEAEGDRSGLAVWDAARLGDGAVATAWFDHRIPLTFHGSWVP